MVPIARRARIFSHGVLTRYPFQANLHGLPPEVIKECLLGVIEARVAGAGAAAAAEPDNFEDYCLRHFGAGISKHFMIPYNEKIWNIAAEQFPGAIEIVDLYHARQQLWELGATLYPTDETRKRRW
jgi:protoporphyrinogen oxidase